MRTGARNHVFRGASSACPLPLLLCLSVIGNRGAYVWCLEPMPHKRSRAGIAAKSERDIRQGYVKARTPNELELVFAPIALLGERRWWEGRLRHIASLS